LAYLLEESKRIHDLLAKSYGSVNVREHKKSESSSSHDVIIVYVQKSKRDEEISVIKHIPGIYDFAIAKPPSTYTTSEKSLSKIVNGKTIYIITKPLPGNPEKYEDREINSLNIQLENIKNKARESGEECIIKLRVGNKIFDVEGVRKTLKINNLEPDVQEIKGMPKSDFEFYDKNGKSVVFISHKKGGGPGAFQQYGGISKLLNNSIIRMYIQKLEEVVFADTGGYDFKSGIGYYQIIKDIELCKKSIYGLNYGQSTYGINNCNIVYQGEGKLVNKGDHYIINAELVHYNGEIPSRNGYKPCIFSRRGESSRMTGKVKNCRTVIIPEATATRSGSMNINLVKKS
jgi:hypothetical protein